MSSPVPEPPISRKFVLEFTKMSGAGNDFIVIDNRFYRFSADELSTMASRFCPRRTGVGADGLLALQVADSEEVDYRMAYYNADGSLGTMCGNGARCLARFAFEAFAGGMNLTFSSDAGIYRADIMDEGIVRLYVPSPTTFRRSMELSGGHAIAADACHYLWTGTEHLVVFVDDVASADVATIGPALRRDGALGDAGANVNFVELLGSADEEGTARLRVRTFEKGVEAETLACGTGSIASSIVAARVHDEGASRYHVEMPGGTLTVGWEGSADEPEGLYLEGPADSIYRGNLEL